MGPVLTAERAFELDHGRWRVVPVSKPQPVLAGDGREVLVVQPAEARSHRQHANSQSSRSAATTPRITASMARLAVTDRARSGAESPI